MLLGIAKGRVATGSAAPHHHPMRWQLWWVLSWQNIKYRSFLQWKFLSDFLHRKTLGCQLSDLLNCETVVDVLVTEL